MNMIKKSHWGFWSFFWGGGVTGENLFWFQSYIFFLSYCHPFILRGLDLPLYITGISCFLVNNVKFKVIKKWLDASEQRGS